MPGLSLSTMDSDEEITGDEIPKKIETSVKMKPITCFFKMPVVQPPRKTSMALETYFSKKTECKASNDAPVSNGYGGVARHSIELEGVSDKECIVKKSKKPKKNSMKECNSPKDLNITAQETASVRPHKLHSVGKKNKLKLSSKFENMSESDNGDKSTCETETISYADFLRSAGGEEQSVSAETDMADDSEENDPTAVSEVTYEDFLKPGNAVERNEHFTEEIDENGNESCGKDLDNGEKTSDNSEMLDSGDKDKEAKDNEDSDEQMERPKCVAITKFFSKVDKKFEVSRPKPEFFHLTVKVDVHPDPSLAIFPGSLSPSGCTSPRNGEHHNRTVGSARKMRKSNVVLNECEIDMSITELESVQILPVKRSGIYSYKHNQDTNNKICPNETTVVSSSNGCDGKHDESDVVIEKIEKSVQAFADLAAEKERRKILADQLAVLDKVSIVPSGKKLQATLNFGTGKMMAVKPAEKVVNVQPSKNSDSAEDCVEELSISPKKGRCKKSDPSKTKGRHGKKESSEGLDDCPSENLVSPKHKRNRRVIVDDSEEDLMKASPKNDGEFISPAKKRRKKSGAEKTTEEDGISKPDVVRAGRKATKAKYAASVVPGKRKGKQRTPIRMRFTKVKSISSTSGEEDVDLTPRSARSRAQIKAKVNTVSKAQELLMKARSTKATAGLSGKASKKKNSQTRSSNGSKNTLTKAAGESTTRARGHKSTRTAQEVIGASPPLRRSSRSSAASAKMAISECVEANGVKRHGRCVSGQPEPDVIQLSDQSDPEQSAAVTIAKKGKRTGVASPRKTPNKKPPAKKKGKLAPIFMQKGVDEGDSSDDVVILPTVDPEVQKIRRNFLMSGVPETMKKQMVATATITASDFPPFPSTSHVQQADSDSIVEHDPQVEPQTTGVAYNPWNLPSVQLNIREGTPSPVNEPQGTDLQLGHISCCRQRETGLMVDKERTLPKFSGELVKFLLAEAHMSNPVYPVRRVYKQLLARRCKAEGISNNHLLHGDASVTCSAKNTEPALAASKKRKLDDAEEEEPTKGRRTKRRKEAGEDVDGSQTGRRLSLRRRSSRRSLDLNPTKQTSEEEKIGKDNQTSGQDNDASANVDKSNPGHAGREMQWTEKYQPVVSGEVLGNSGAVKKLKGWLTEWKHRTNVEMRKMKKQLLKEARRAGKTKEDVKKKLGGDWWTDDESDFALDSSDEDSEDQAEQEDNLLNAMLITGPHGTGKTALVYTLAQELGYKVFEVNASSRRNGKHVLAQLQEATQSHQVAKTNLDTMYTTFMATADTKISPTGGKVPAKKMPAAFSNFFHKSSGAGPVDKGSKNNNGNASSPARGKKQKDGKEAVKRKKRRKSDEDVIITKHETPKKNPKQISLFGKQVLPSGDPPTPNTPGGNKKGLNLASTSLILFEEVDVVFEEDKGFWAAIQTFASSTKRPIILTSSSSRVSDLLNTTHDLVKLKKVAPENTASYLQLVCLAEDLRVCHDDLRTLVDVLQGDLRRLLLSLQFWAQSSGGLTLAENQPIKYLASFFEKKEEICNSAVSDVRKTPLKGFGVNSAAKFRDSGDEFEVLKPRVRRRRAPVIEDESSQDTVSGTPKKCTWSCSNNLTVIDESSQSGTEGLGKSQLDSRSAVVEASSVAPPSVHMLCCESITGTAGCLHEKNTTQVLCGGDFGCSAQLVQQYSSQGVDIVYSNLPQLLALPVMKSGLPRHPLVPALKLEVGGEKKMRRIKNNCDLFDSEGEDSSGGFVTLPKVSAGNNEMESANSGKHKVSAVVSGQKKWTLQDKLLLDSVQAMSQLYDNMSFVDSHLHVPNVHREGTCGRNCDFDWDARSLACGLTDEHSGHEEIDWWKWQGFRDIAANVQVGSLHQSNHCLAKVTSRLDQLEPKLQSAAREDLSLPVEEICDRLQVSQERPLQVSLGGCLRKAAANTASCLPATVERRGLALDYLPTLRTICRAEQCREAAKVKRRFFHYLDQIHLPLRQSTIDTLCSSFS